MVQHVCKGWRVEALKHPVDLNVSLASQTDQDSLAAWLQHNELKSATHLQQAAHATDLLQCQDLVRQRLAQPSNAQRWLLTNKKQLDLESVLRDAGPDRGVITDGSDAADATKEDVKYCLRQVNSLNLSVWVTWRLNIEDNEYIIDKDLEMSHRFWKAMQTARVQHLTLGEFPSDDFVRQMHVLTVPSVIAPPGSIMAPSLRHLEALTLHLNCYSITDLFYAHDEGAMYAFQDLYQLTSLTLKASEMLPGGQRVKHGVPGKRLLPCLPSTLRTLSLHNFRARWDPFQDLSTKPSLVHLDLSESSFMLPDTSAWTQLHSLTLKDSLAWLENAAPFHFHALTQLTRLELPGCLFGLCMPGMLGNTHQHKISRFQAPTSIVKLDINTKAIKVGQYLCSVTSCIVLIVVC